MPLDQPLEQSEGPSVSDTEQNTDRLPGKKPKKSKPQEAHPQIRPKPAPAKSTPGKSLAGLALIVSACALGLSVYIAWRAKPLEQNQPILREGMDQLQTQIARQQARLTEVAQNLSLTLEEQEDQLQALQNREARLLSRVDTIAVKMRELEGSSRNQWRIAEVEYLLRLANERLITINDADSALRLMVSAEEILQQLDDYGLFAVREALAEDIAVLKSTTFLNKEQIWLRLQAIQELIPGLVTLDDSHLTKAIAPPAVKEKEQKTTDQNWQQTIKAILLNTWERFTALFHVNKQRAQPVEVLLFGEEELLVRQKLQLLLEQGQLALISGQQSVYHKSLQQADKLLGQYFMLGGALSKQVKQEIEALVNLSIVAQMPNIHRALDALNDYEESLTLTPEPRDNLPDAETAPDSETLPDKEPAMEEALPTDTMPPPTTNEKKPEPTVNGVPLS